MTGSAQIIRGNALALPLADASVDLVVTSPPYFGLRSYQDTPPLCERCLELTGHGWKFPRTSDTSRDLRQAWPDWDAHVKAEHKPMHYPGQIGSEATPAEFVDALIAATREMVRVLKPSGSIWLNLGDKYAGSGGGGEGSSDGQNGRHARPPRRASSIPTKSLMGIPWRYALRCIDDLGLILRAEVIWGKLNGLPESVTDRVRRSHEQWFHFVVNPKYYSAVDEIREPHLLPPNGATFGGTKANAGRVGSGERTYGHNTYEGQNPLGKLPGSVWTVTNDVSPIRGILDAVAAGGITAEEGERLWTGLSDFSRMWISPANAGSGPDTKIPEDTGNPPRESAKRTGRTGSPTGFSSDPSPMGSPSTISAGTSPASSLNTSNQSPDARTFGELTPSEPSASSATPWPTHTQTPPPLASPTRSAAHAPSPGSDAGESVWQVATQPLKVPAELGIDHFAAFPFEFPRRIIRGWSPSGVCSACGEGRRPVMQKTRMNGSVVVAGAMFQPGQRTETADGRRHQFQTEATITGYACSCPGTTAPTIPAVVLDPFGGTGTTALMATALGRRGISVDMSSDYCRLATWRTTDPGQMAAALQVEKPDAVSPDQLDLFGELIA